MNKKNIATTIVLLLCSVLFAVTGSSFMNFVYQKNKIMVSDPVVVASEGVLVYDANDHSKGQLEKLKFSDMSLGLKPVTGKTDQKTNIPSTVTDKKGTEGLYAPIKITAPAGIKIIATNLQIESKEDAEKVNAERKNLWLALKDVEDSAKNFEEELITLTVNPEATEDYQYTILFWLDSNASESLKGVKISFEMQFIV